MIRNSIMIKGMLLASLVLAALSFTGCASQVEKLRTQGIEQYQREQYDQSLASLNAALKIDEFDAQSNTYAGLIHYRAGNLQQASYHFKTALDADPSSEEAKAGLTATLVRLGKPDLAIDYLERSAELAMHVEDPRWKKTLINRRYQNQTEERLFLGKVEDRLRIGLTFEKLGDYDNALVYYKKAEALAPTDANVLMAVALLYEKVGNKPECREYLGRAYRASPTEPAIREAMTRNRVAISDIDR